MSKYKDLAKEKWDTRPHANIRGRAAGLVGRGKDDSSSLSSAPDHVSRPLSDLQDPSSFAPPPRRTATGLAPPPPPSTAKRKVVAAPSKYQDPRGPPVEPPPKFSDEYALAEAEEPSHAAPSGKPWSVNSTGLRTDHLPPPPPRRDGADGRAPPSYDVVVAPGGGGGGGGGGRSPALPPRLPPRTNSGHSSLSSPTQTSPAHTGNGSGMLNQGAVNRLGAAGVSVPALGIGRPSPANSPDHASTPPAQPPRPRPGANNAQTNELQNRFSRMTTNATAASPPAQATPPAAEGTSWQQKQAALRTASAFHKDPSSVSLSDARSAAGTVNNFRQRHGDQVAAGLKSANGLNERYGVADRVGSYAGSTSTSSPGGQGAGGSASTVMASIAAKKKPPPPPKKKPGLAGPVRPTPAEDEPPPIPMASRPVF